MGHHHSLGMEVGVQRNCRILSKARVFMNISWVVGPGAELEGGVEEVETSDRLQVWAKLWGGKFQKI